jgi:predicted AAA+ superfamily ATPase
MVNELNGVNGVNELNSNPDILKIFIDDKDHLYNCIKFFSPLYLDDKSTGILSYSSKFKMKEKKNKVFTELNKGMFYINYYKKIDIDINIFITHIGCPVGLDSETAQHSEMYLYINKDHNDKLEKFLDEASIWYVDNILDTKKESDKTTIYLWDDYWETLEKRSIRPLSTIYLGGKEVEILDNIKEFFAEDTKKLYNTLGIPYKHNILFHGYPGTGKSSLIFSLASELKMDIALLQFVHDMDDVDFMKAMRRIPDNTVLVLEDIDVLFESRKKNDDNKTGISFSGLLNSLDGICHVDNQVIFMTTNCKMVLDKALIRPGRIDMDVEFKYSTKEQIKQMFDKFLPKQTDKFNAFYKEIKNNKITTAILQQYLFGNIKCDNILDTVDDLKELCSNNSYDFKKDSLYT